MTHKEIFFQNDLGKLLENVKTTNIIILSEYIANNDFDFLGLEDLHTL